MDDRHGLRHTMMTAASTLVADARTARKRRQVARHADPYARDSAPVRELLDTGITILPRHFDATVSQAARAQVETVIKAHPESTRLRGRAVLEVRDAEGARGWDTGMIDIHHADDAIEALAPIRDDPQLADIVAATYGHPVRPTKVNIYVNKGITKTRGFHVDSFHADQWKALVYLTDVEGPAAGPYAYVRGSHRFNTGKYRNLFANARHPERPLTDIHFPGPDEHVIQALGPAGTTALSNQRGYHRGLPQEPDQLRIVAVVQYIG